MGKREQHIRALAEELGVEVHLLKNSRYGGAWGTAGMYYHADWASAWFGINEPGYRWIVIEGWSPRSQQPYFAALHELGHHAMGHMPESRPLRGEDGYRSRILEAEAEAWAWALEQTPEEPNAGVLEKMQGPWLASYVRDFGLSTRGPVFSAIAARFNLALAA